MKNDERRTKLLNKYLNKKEKQKKRDFLLEEIAKINAKIKPNNISSEKNKKRKNYNNLSRKIVDIDLEQKTKNLEEETNHLESDVFTIKKQELNTSISNAILSQNEDISEINQEKSIEQKIIHEKSKPNLQLGLTFNRKNEVDLFRKTLEVFYQEDDIISTIKKYDIILIQGNTGCGKSTQIPQFILENFDFENKIMAMTQPRRISAITISRRLNYELNNKLAAYKIKYEDTTSNQTKIKIMTDGVLINEMKNDFLLTKYSFIILDEVHERNINIDILIPLLLKVVYERNKTENKLKLILMSATLDANHFKKIFEDKIGNLRLNSNNYKVHVFYEQKTQINYIDVAFEKIKKILNSKEYKDGHEFNRLVKQTNYKIIDDALPKNIKNNDNANILVFLPSKEDIYNLINKIKNEQLDVLPLPLHSSLSFNEQKLIFQASSKRKVIVSTNIAETSITVPDIVFVIDSGRAKCKIYEENGCFSYKIDFISKSSANQRMGRAGRMSDGICYRLYSGKLFDHMIDNEIPEILRSPLDEIVLNLKHFGIKNIHDFPFIDAPDNNQIIASIHKLKCLGALNDNEQLTETGNEMGRYPLPVRLSRMLITDKDIIKEVTLLVSILASNLEIDKCKTNKIYFFNSKSDIISKMKILIDFYYTENKKEFCEKNLLRYHELTEIIKGYFYLMNFKFKTSEFVEILNDEKIERLRKYIVYNFCDNLATKINNDYYFGNKKVHFSKESIHVHSENVVFDSLVLGTNKLYMKNITEVEKEWIDFQ